jgi:hypothetical protein
MQQSGVRSRVNSVQLNVRHCRKTFHDEMFYRCLTVMNDNSYDNIIYIHVRISHALKTVYYYLQYYLYVVCGTSIHIISHEIIPSSSGCRLFSLECVLYFEPITVEGGKMSKEE